MRCVSPAFQSAPRTTRNLTKPVLCAIPSYTPQYQPLSTPPHPTPTPHAPQPYIIQSRTPRHDLTWPTPACASPPSPKSTQHPDRRTFQGNPVRVPVWWITPERVLGAAHSGILRHRSVGCLLIASSSIHRYECGPFLKAEQPLSAHTPPPSGVVHFHEYTLGFLAWTVTMSYWRIFHFWFIHRNMVVVVRFELSNQLCRLSDFFSCGCASLAKAPVVASQERACPRRRGRLPLPLGPFPPPQELQSHCALWHCTWSRLKPGRGRLHRPLDSTLIH